MSNTVWSADKGWHDGPEVRVGLDDKDRLVTAPVTTYGRKSYAISGYAYQADLICTDCARAAAAFALAAPGEAAFMGRPTDGDNTEAFLDRWAASVGIDRMDERTYDSGDFPKVVFFDGLEGTETCGECGCEL
jgi:hypothetical protein